MCFPKAHQATSCQSIVILQIDSVVYHPISLGVLQLSKEQTFHLQKGPEPNESCQWTWWTHSTVTGPRQWELEMVQLLGIFKSHVLPISACPRDLFSFHSLAKLHTTVNYIRAGTIQPKFKVWLCYIHHWIILGNFFQFSPSFTNLQNKSNNYL